MTVRGSDLGRKGLTTASMGPSPFSVAFFLRQDPRGGCLLPVDLFFDVL
jgi:hypothetical protein